jgi:hypothetical protein
MSILGSIFKISKSIIRILLIRINKFLKNLEIKIKFTVNVSHWWLLGHTWVVKKAKIVSQSSVGHLAILVIYWSIALTSVICSITWYSQNMEWITLGHTYINISTSLWTIACSDHRITKCFWYSESTVIRFQSLWPQWLASEVSTYFLLLYV